MLELRVGVLLYWCDFEVWFCCLLFAGLISCVLFGMVWLLWVWMFACLDIVCCLCFCFMYLVLFVVMLF